jgi:hypothetical protein
MDTPLSKVRMNTTKYTELEMNKYIIITLSALSISCASNRPAQVKPDTIDEIIPQEDGVFDLLYTGDTYAYKSVTIKDYIGEKEWN